MTELYAQGDVLLELVADVPAHALPKKLIKADPDGSVVLARGEATGHRHRFAPDNGVVMFRDDGLARDMPTELYIGHIKIASKEGAELRHEEHDQVHLPAGTYRVRRQREWNSEVARVVAD